MPKQVKSSLRWVASRDTGNQVFVWDWLVRILHWSLVASFATAWLTPGSLQTVHDASGYVAFGIVVLRLFWGFTGTPYARFAQFLRRPTAVCRYLWAIGRAKEARYIGHNPAGGAMVVALLAVMAATAVSGYMLTTDRYWGVAWVTELHELLADGLLILIGLHVAGVLLASFRHRENLIRAMLSGYKRGAGSHD